jgi:hypothetical protein
MGKKPSSGRKAHRPGRHLEFVLLSPFPHPGPRFADHTHRVPHAGLDPKIYLLSRDAVLLPLADSLVLLFSFFAESLIYGVYYLIILFLLIALWFPERLFRKRLESPG